MLQSKLFTKTLKEAPHEAESKNAVLLARAGFVDQVSAGVYTYLPLGLRVLEKIKKVIREEMRVLGAEEIYMPALVPKTLWNETGRWNEIDVLFKLKGHGDKEYGLGSTHEEVVTPLVKKFVNSYKDLPLAVYQIQDKFRDEPRAKAGLLRGREFSMKDLYSFHLTEDDLSKYYEKVKRSYLKIFERCGLNALVVEASGGVFSPVSHEFQVLTSSGEDIVFYCDCGWAQNREIAKAEEGDKCPHCNNKKIKKDKAIEVGNIFPLKTKFSDAFDFKVLGSKGERLPVLMGCYGIGPSRVMGAIVEVHNDEKGIIWPEEVAPYLIHIIRLKANDKKLKAKLDKTANELYENLIEKGIEALYDDREEVSAGEKFADADLIGCPWRIVVSEKSLAAGGVEVKRRDSDKVKILKFSEVLKLLI